MHCEPFAASEGMLNVKLWSQFTISALQDFANIARLGF